MRRTILSIWFLILALIACAITTVPPSRAQENKHPCQKDWRDYLEPEPGFLVYVPEYQPTTDNDSLLSAVVKVGTVIANPAQTLTVVQFVVDTLGQAVDVKVLCSPSEFHSERVRTLVHETDFVAARNRGKPIRYPMTLPLAMMIREE